MNKDKETKKLGAEELEKRVAPLAIYNQDGTADQESVGGDSTTDGAEAPRGDADRSGVVERPR